METPDDTQRGFARLGRPATIAGIVALALVVVVHVLDAVARAGEPSSAMRLTLAALSVAAGLATIAFGVLVALRRKLRWWSLLAIPLIAVGLFWSAVPAGLAWMATHGAASGDPGLAADVAGPGYRDVSVPVADGVTLAGWYLPAENGATVVLLPGAGGSTRRGVLPHARSLAAAGYGVLLLDPRGHGGSGGRALEYGWHGETDVRAALDWLATQPDVDPARMAVLGLSMGGEQALTAAAGDDRIAAVVAEGATERVYEDVRRTLGVSVVLGVPQYRALFGLVELLGDAEPPVPLEDAVERIAPRPVLLADTESEARYGRRYKAAAPETTELWAPASGSHIKAHSEDRAEWERRVVPFLDAALGVER